MAPDGNPCIPPDLWIDILSYLPAKSLLRFRSICKYWKAIIDNPEFSFLHIGRYANNQKDSHVIVLEKNSLLNQVKARCLNPCTVTNSNQQTSEISFLLPEHHVVGNVNGLLLVEKYPSHQSKLGDTFLWNPSIRKQLLLPPPPSEPYVAHLFLGFDPSTNDYKVVNIGDGDRTRSHSVVSFEIFSLNTGSWRRGGTQLLISPYGEKVSFAGSVHWIGSWDRDSYESDSEYDDDDYDDKCYKEFVSFSMVSETCSCVQLPYNKYIFKMHEVPVVVAGSLVGLLAFGDTVDIWVLERDVSWSKRFTIDSWRSITCDCFSLSSEMLHLNKDGVLISGFCTREKALIWAYNLHTGNTTVVSECCQWSNFYVGAYVESLVLLNQGQDY